MSNNTGNIVLALLAGAVVGAGIGILVAPDKGSNTRKKIKDGFDFSKDEILEKVNELIASLKGNVSEAVSNFDELLENAIEKSATDKEEMIALLEQKLAALKAPSKA